MGYDMVAFTMGAMKAAPPASAVVAVTPDTTP